MHPAIQKLIILAKAEKKQTITLGVLVVLALGLWARAAATSGNRAQASDSASASAPAPASAKSEPQKKPAAVVIVPPAPKLDRDLFLPRSEDFALPAQTDPGEGSGAKSALDTDDNIADRNNLPRLTPEQQIRSEASRLTLRSTVVGNEPIAVVEADVSGTTERFVLRLGDSAFGFTLRGVHNRSARLEKGGVVVELTIPLD